MTVAIPTDAVSAIKLISSEVSPEISKKIAFEEFLEFDDGLDYSDP